MSLTFGILLIVLIILIYYYYQTQMATVSHLTLDQSRNQAETQDDWHADSHVKNILDPHYYDATDTAKYLKYFKNDNIDAITAQARADHELEYNVAKNAKMTFLPDHDVLIGGMTYEDDDSSYMDRTHTINQ